VDINKRIKERRTQKEKHEKLLKIETDKLEASSRLKRDEISEEISKIRQSVDDKVKKAKQFRVEQRELGEQIKEARDRLNRVHRDGSDMRQRKEEIRRAIDNSEAQRGDRMRAFGHNMPQVLEAIRRETHWRKRKPVGPLGATLELLHPQYSETLEVFFSKTLNAFVVECFEDKSLLYQILVRYKMNFNPIYVSEYDLFDYSSGEPDEQYLTVLRAIRFEDEWVKRQLIIANKIEKTLLMENRAEADEVMYSKPRNAHLCFTSGGHKVGGKSGMKTETLDAHRGPQRFRTDVDVQIRKLQEELDEIGKSYNGLEQQAQRLSNEISDLERQQRACRQNENRIDLEIKSLERKIEEKEDILKEDDPVDLNMYEENIKECTESIKSLALQFQSINNQRDATLTELKEILKQIKVIQDKEDARERMSDEYRTKINKLHDIKSKLHAKLDEYASQRHSLRSRYESRKSVYNEALSYAAQWIEECKDEYPDRMETERDPTTVNNEIKGLQAQAARMEEEMGQSMAEVKRIAGEKGNSYLEAKSVIEGMEKLNRSLRKMLEKRMEKWKSFRDYMSLSASQYFGYYLHLRGDEGSLRFNHTSKRLDLRVSTGDQFKKGSRQKDSRSLSGGEKSFSQISLLLSLWQSISSPIIW
jgi:chromosome segregation ATPase